MEELYDRETLLYMDRVWEQGQALVKEFRKRLDSKSRTSRSIDRGDCWSETASWARRDGHHDFAVKLDLHTLEFNDLVPKEFRY